MLHLHLPLPPLFHHHLLFIFGLIFVKLFLIPFIFIIFLLPIITINSDKEISSPLSPSSVLCLPLNHVPSSCSYHPFPHLSPLPLPLNNSFLPLFIFRLRHLLYLIFLLFPFSIFIFLCQPHLYLLNLPFISLLQFSFPFLYKFHNSKKCSV